MITTLTNEDVLWWEDVLDCWEATGIITEKEWLDSMTRFLNTFGSDKIVKKDKK